MVVGKRVEVGRRAVVGRRDKCHFPMFSRATPSTLLVHHITTFCVS
jgi:hypothetical protein